MNPAHRPPTSLPDDAGSEDDVVLPAAEAMLAGTLALMTGYAEHRPSAGAAPDHVSPPSLPHGQAVPHLLAAKVASHLFCLSEHPLLSPGFRSTLWRLRAHWQSLERRTAPPPPAAAPPMAAAFWLEGTPTRH